MRNPTKLFVTISIITVLCFLLAALIGQHNDGPWGDLPEWLGAVGWFGFLIGAVLTVVSGIYALMQLRGTSSATE